MGTPLNILKITC